MSSWHPETWFKHMVQIIMNCIAQQWDKRVYVLWGNVDARGLQPCMRWMDLKDCEGLWAAGKGEWHILAFRLVLAWLTFGRTSQAWLGVGSCGRPS